MEKRLLIYLAAPLFSEAEREWNRRFAERIAERLPGARLIVPQEFMASGPDRHGSLHAQCIEGVEQADVVVAVLDGPDVDSGVAWEMGYARGLGKPVVGVRTDFRESQEEGVNLMCSRGCDGFVRATALDDECAGAAASVAVELRRVCAASLERAPGRARGA